MAVIDCNYLPTATVEFQPELALLIVRRAKKMAAAFEEKSLDQMTNDARRALQRAVESRVIARRCRSRTIWSVSQAWPIPTDGGNPASV